MLGYFHYNRFGGSGFTDKGKGRCTTSVQTCPVCLCRFDANGGVLPDGTGMQAAQWRETVCTKIKDETVSGGYQAGCLAQAFPPF